MGRLLLRVARRAIVGTCNIAVERGFGPQVHGCLDDFDFTLFFEETILSIGPTALVLIAIPPRIFHLWRQARKSREGFFCWIKLVAVALLSIIQILLLALISLPQTPKTSASIACAALNAITAIGFCVLSYLEHTRSVRPSAILTTYISFSLLGDIVRSRTLWAIHDNRLVAIGFTTSIAWKVVVLILESVEKRRLLYGEYTSYPPEATGSIWNIRLFCWLNPLLFDGFAREIGIGRLYPNDKGLLPEPELAPLSARWSRANQQSPHALLWVFTVHYKWTLASAVIPRLLLTGFRFAQPFLVHRAVAYASGQIDNTNYGYGLIAAYFLVYVGIALSDVTQQHKTYRLITMIRGTLVNMIYQRTLQLDSASLDSSAALTLMSADIDRIGTGLRNLHEIWASIIEVALALWLLQGQIGVATVSAALMTLLCTGSAVWVAGSLGIKQSNWLQHVQKRVEATASMLGSMKGIKMSGLTEPLSRDIKNLREAEMDSSLEFRSTLVKIVALSYSSTSLTPVIAFGVFAILAKLRNTTGLTSAMVFMSLLLFELLASPVAMLIDALAGTMSAVGSFERIRKYLTLDSRLDPALAEVGISQPSLLEVPEKPSLSSEKSTPIDDWPHSWGLNGPVIANPTDSQTMLLREISLSWDLPFQILDSDAELYKQSCVAGRNFSAGWDSEKMVLNGLNFDIKRTQLTMIIGPVGCGKSTFINALLGETPHSTGSLTRSFADAAYCSQTPWIANGTVRENIIGIMEMDDIWYETVIRACALDTDIQQLSKGDETLVGSKGAALSGGQQMRLCIARAVYARKSVIFLDDIFSGLDATTEERVFEGLLGPEGVLRRSRMTVILVTHAMQLLSSADHIIALNEDGRITEQGDFDDLNASPEYAKSLLKRKRSKPALSKVKSNTPARPAAVLNDTAPVADRRTGDMSVYKYYADSCRWWSWLILLSFAAAYGFGAIFPQVWIQWWATANEEHPNGRLGYYLGIYALLNVFTVVSLFGAARHLVINLVPTVARRMHKVILATALNAPMSFFHSTDTGITLNRFSQDLQLIDMDLPLALINVVIIACVLLAQIFVISITGKYVAVAIPVVGVIIYFVQKFYLRTSRQLRFLEIEAKAPLFTHFLETLEGLTSIRAFGWQNEYTEINKKILDTSQRPYYLLFSIQRWLSLVLDLIVAGIAVVLIIITVEGKGKISSSLIGLALVNIASFSTNLKLLITNWTLMETSIGAVSRIRAFEQETQNENSDNHLKSDPPAEWPARGLIELNGISAAYRSTGKTVLNQISLEIKAGQKIGICGRSGSGKSSLVATLFRMLDLEAGAILVDGVDISGLPREQVRSHLNAIPQEPYLLAGSVRTNVDPLGTASDDVVISAMKKVRLWDMFKDKGGLTAPITDKTFSHGQRQLVCLARALLRKSSVLVLDEVTSSVDVHTDKLMQEIIREEFPTQTIIAIAHRLDTIMDFDKIAVFDHGVLLEYDSPEVLLQSKSAFRDLYMAQTGQDADDTTGEDQGALEGT